MSRMPTGKDIPERILFAEQVRQFSGKYTTLLGALGSAGTEVDRERVLETDLDIEPDDFTRAARHIFVFPPQEVELRTKEGVVAGELPGTSPSTLVRESQAAEYDPSRVEGRVVVTYDDAGATPQLLAIDTLEDGSPSALPASVLEALGEAFSQLATIN